MIYLSAVEDPAARLIEALDVLGAVADDVTADQAYEEVDAATLQVFWREWPAVSSWAGALWRRLNADLAQPARPPRDADLDEIGESG